MMEILVLMTITADQQNLLGDFYSCDEPGLCETADGAICNGDGTCTYGSRFGNRVTMAMLVPLTTCQLDGSCVGLTILVTPSILRHCSWCNLQR